MDYINTLPPELLVRIFSYLHPAEIFKTVSLVCKRWNKIFRVPELWKRTFSVGKENCYLSFEYRETSDPSRIQVLTLVGLAEENISYIISVIAEACPHLRSICLYNCCVPVLALDHVAKHCQNLTTIQMVESRKMICERTNALYSLCNVKCLKVQSQENSEEYKSLQAMIRGMTNLESLAISGWEVGNKVIKTVASCRKLKFLSLRGDETSPHHEKLRPFALRQLFRKPFEQLTDLVLCKLSPVDDVLVQLIAKQCPQLESLSLKLCSRVTDKGIESVVRNCPDLVTLDVSMLSKLTGKCFYDIQSFLPKLKNVYIYHCSGLTKNALRHMLSMKLVLSEDRCSCGLLLEGTINQHR